MLGASFDSVEDNRAFAVAQDFGFPLLSNVDRAVGTAYEVLREGDDQSAGFPLRISYLIDPTGLIRKAYSVSDVGGHAGAVLADLASLSAA